MSDACIDTSVVIRLLTGDDAEKQARSRALFQRIERGDLSVRAPATVIADAVFILSSKKLYNRSRSEIAALLTPLVRLPGFHVQSRSAVLSALHLYETTHGLDFGDALLAATAQQGSGVVYSYDRDFDRVSGVTRNEP